MNNLNNYCRWWSIEKQQLSLKLQQPNELKFIFNENEIENDCEGLVTCKLADDEIIRTAKFELKLTPDQKVSIQNFFIVLYSVYNCALSFLYYIVYNSNVNNINFKLLRQFMRFLLENKKSRKYFPKKCKYLNGNFPKNPQDEMIRELFVNYKKLKIINKKKYFKTVIWNPSVLKKKINNDYKKSFGVCCKPDMDENGHLKLFYKFFNEKTLKIKKIRTSSVT